MAVTADPYGVHWVAPSTDRQDVDRLDDHDRALRFSSWKMNTPYLVEDFAK
jgi:hypothetical protein